MSPALVISSIPNFLSLISNVATLRNNEGGSSQDMLHNEGLDNPRFTTSIYDPPPYTYDQISDYDSLPEVGRQVLVDNGVMKSNLRKFTPRLVSDKRRCHLIDFANSRSYKEVESALAAWKIQYTDNEEHGTLFRSTRREVLIEELKTRHLPLWYVQLDAYVAGNDAFVWLEGRQSPEPTANWLDQDNLLHSRDQDISDAVRTLLYWADFVVREHCKSERENELKRRLERRMENGNSILFTPCPQLSTLKLDDDPRLRIISASPEPVSDSDDGDDLYTPSGAYPTTPLPEYASAFKADHEMESIGDDSSLRVLAEPRGDCADFPVPNSAPFWIKGFGEDEGVF